MVYKRVVGFLVNVSLTLVTLLVVLLLMEVVLRLFSPQNLNFNIPDASLGYKNRPNMTVTYSREEFSTTIAINSKGLRDYEYEYPKPEGTKRILALGDSFTFGYGVELEDTIPKILERRLNENSAKKYEVINGGVPGYGTAHSLGYLEDEGFMYDPDIVLLLLFSNDVYDDAGHGPFEIKEGVLIRTPYDFNIKLMNLRNFLSSKLHIYSFIGHQIIKIKNLNPTREEGFSNRALFEANSNLTDPYWDLNRAILERMADVLSERNVTFVVAYIPSMEYVDEDALRGFLDYYALKREEVNLTKFKEESSYLLNKENVYLFDPSFSLYMRNMEGPLYYPKDTHFNKDGTHFYADMLSDFLQQTVLY